MSIVRCKHLINKFIIISLFLLLNCQLQEPKKYHGINYLEKRSKILVVNKSNKNDVIALIGNPHSKSLDDEDRWFYFERTITRGKMHKLGQNILRDNNILEIQFNKYGILSSKKMYTKDDMKKIKSSEKTTKNTVEQKSFVNKFLESVRQKMYRGKR